MLDLISNNGMIKAMDASMTLASRRMALVASNLANIDTPGYKTQDFSFQDAFRNEMTRFDGRAEPLWRTNPGHLMPVSSASLPPANEPVKSAYERNDGNDVNLDRESMLLARTQGTYQLSANFMQVEVRRIYQMIREGAK